MKIKDFKPYIHSYTGCIQLVIIYSLDDCCDLEHGCSAEYAYKKYGDLGLKRICSCAEHGQDYIVFEI